MEYEHKQQSLGWHGPSCLQVFGLEYDLDLFNIVAVGRGVPSVCSPVIQQTSLEMAT